jgi:hypothetical protein
MLFPGRGVIHPAAWAGKYLSRPDAVGHFDIRVAAVPFQPVRTGLSKGPFEDLNPIAAIWLIGMLFGPLVRPVQIKSPGRSRGFSIRRKIASQA